MPWIRFLIRAGAEALGAVVAVVGDDWRQIQIGIVITGFGVTWWILGQILRAVTPKR